MRQSNCPDYSGLGSPTTDQPDSPPPGRRVVVIDGRERELVLRPGCRPGYRAGRYEWQDGVRASTLPATDKHVAIVGLAAHMDRMGNNSRPGLERLEKELTLTRRTIIRSTRNLERQGFLDTRRSRGGRGQTNRYLPLLPVPDELLATLELEEAQAGKRQTAPAAPALPLKGELVPDAEHDLLIAADGVRLVPAEPAANEDRDGEPEPVAAILAGVMGEVESRPQAGALAVDTAAETVYLVPPESLAPPVRATHPESCTPGPCRARASGGRQASSSNQQPEPDTGAGPRLTRRFPAELLTQAVAVISLLHVPTTRRRWLQDHGPAVEAIAELLSETGAPPAPAADAIEAPGPLWPCERLGGLVVHRVAKARELLAARRRADQHAAELDAGGSDWRAIAAAPAKARGEVVRASAAAALAEIAAATDPKEAPRLAPWRARRPRQAPVPELLRQAEALAGDGTEDGPAAGLGA